MYLIKFTPSANRIPFFYIDNYGIYGKLWDDLISNREDQNLKTTLLIGPPHHFVSFIIKISHVTALNQSRGAKQTNGGIKYIIQMILPNRESNRRAWTSSYVVEIIALDYAILQLQDLDSVIRYGLCSPVYCYISIKYQQYRVYQLNKPFSSVVFVANHK